MNAFHFLRPDWLWALIPAAAVLALLWRRRAVAGGRDWSGTVDAHLLRHLTVGGAAVRPQRARLAALAGGLLAAVLALAGPSWEKVPTPTARGTDPVVAVVSLAQSMNGTDLVPSRLARAGHKLRDILDREAGDDVGLVIYADRPFVAAPLTPDGNVIREMLPELSTGLMPVLGNRLDRAIGTAQQLLASAGAGRGRILVMADDMGADPAASLAAAQAARKAGYKVSVLGVGTAEGATLQTANGQAISVNGAGPTVAKLDADALQGLAAAGGGSYSEVTATSADIDRLLPSPVASATRAGAVTDLTADRWRDRGYLLIWIPALLLPFAFRRGVLFALAVAVLPLGLFGARPAEAAPLDSLWATPDQQGARAFADGDFAAAATVFETPDWRASALYRAGDYAAAATAYGNAGFNAGNALAKAGDFEAALAAYDGWLADNPGDADARFNRDLVAELLQQEQEQQRQDQDQDQQSGQQQDQQSGQSQDQQQGQQGDQPQDQQSAQSQGGQGDQPQDQPSGQQQDQQSAQSQDQTGDPSSDQTGDTVQAAAQGEDGGSQDQPSQAGTETAADAPQSGSGTDNQQQAYSAMAQPGATEQAPGDQPAQVQAGTPGEPGSEESGLSQLIDSLLAGNGRPEDAPEADARPGATAGTPLSQSAEQQLRAVPDDPTGLLRARIAMHYAQLRASGQ